MEEVRRKEEEGLLKYSSRFQPSEPFPRKAGRTGDPGGTTAGVEPTAQFQAIPAGPVLPAPSSRYNRCANSKYKPEYCMFARSWPVVAR